MSVSAQELSKKSRMVGISFGFTHSTFKDDRISARSFNNWLPTYQLRANSMSDITRQNYSMTFTQKSKIDDKRLIDLKYLRPVVTYSLEKKINGTWIGGYLRSNTLLAFPVSRTGHFNNSPISYTMSIAFGPKLSWIKDADVGSNKIQLSSSIEAPLLSYMIRPAYGHPYPERYLTDGVFSPTREKMAASLLKSGKLMNLGKHQAVKVMFSISYFISDKVHLELQYGFDYARINDVNTSSIMDQNILAGINYSY